MRILGIDPALAITGYGVIDAKKDKAVLWEAGIIQTSARQPLAERLQTIHQGIVDLIEDAQPQVMVLEKLYAHYRHPTTAYLLGYARGVICLAAAQKNLSLVEYSATRIKKAITGHGLASKHQVQYMIVNRLGLRSIPKYADVTDALGLAVAHGYMITKAAYL